MRTRSWSRAMLSAALVGPLASMTCGASGVAVSCAGTGVAPVGPIPFGRLSITFEVNVSGEDAGVLFHADTSQQLADLAIVGPDGRVVYEFDANDYDGLGLTENFWETAEPDIDSAFRAYPEGEYVVTAHAHNGTIVRGTVMVSHEIPRAPVVLAPEDGQTLRSTEVIFRWKPDPAVRSYSMEIDNLGLQQNYTIPLPPGVHEFQMPAVLVPEGDYVLILHAIGSNGNETVIETEFTTIDGPIPGFTADFDLDDCNLVPDGGNAHFTLRPGRFWRYEGTEEDGTLVQLDITVLSDTQLIPFEIDGESVVANARVIEERERKNGELYEVARNYFARCESTGDIYYFGEDVDFYEDGVIIGHAGTWRAGVDDARPGLIMPRLFMLGARYFQEIAPDIALDRAEHAEMGLTITTPAGTFEDCVLVRETTPLEPGAANWKTYASGVGLIASDELMLVETGLLACAADFNHDGAVNSADFFRFLTALFEADPDADPNADVNDDDSINSQDYFDFISIFFAGCP